MEKYRKWTDEATGINPFINAKRKKQNIAQKIISFIIGVVKFILLIAYLPLFLVLTVLPIQVLQKFAVQIMIWPFSVYSIDDKTFINSINKQESNSGKIILSNHLCFLDVFYFILRFPNSKFVHFTEDKDGQQEAFSVMSKLSTIWKIFFKVQVFYQIKQNQNSNSYDSLTKLIQGFEQNLHKGKNLIIFYEKIRTNGLGTIKLTKSQAQDLYNCEDSEKKMWIAQIKYSSTNQSIFGLTKHPIATIFSSLSSLIEGNSIKVRSVCIEKSQIHSGNQFKASVLQFVTANSCKLLETKPKSYYEFIDFFNKTQKQMYLN